MTITKKCTKCKEEKPATREYFYRHPRGDGLRTQCKSCSNKVTFFCGIKRKYGITKEEYNNMLKEQNGKCVICGIDFNNTYQIDIDHNHKTSKVRGLLCSGCNTGLGKFKENTFILIKAIKYLEKYK